MYQPSQAYLDHIGSSYTFQPVAKVVVDGVEYTGDEYLKTYPKIQHAAEKMIGGFPAKTVDFEIWNRDGSIDLHGKEVAVWRGLRLPGVFADSEMVLSVSVANWTSTTMTLTLVVFVDVMRVLLQNTATGTAFTFAQKEAIVTNNEDGTETWVIQVPQNILAGLPDTRYLRIAVNIDGAWNEGTPQYMDSVEWIPMGMFAAADEDIKTSKTGLSIAFHGTDRTRLFNKAYGGALEYPATLGAFVQDICDRAGIPLETPDFPLYDHALPERPNFPEDYPERDLIARAAELGGCIAQISRAGGLRIAQPTATGRTVWAAYFKTLEAEPPYPPINSVALGHADYDDAILQEDEAAVEANGKSEWLVADNPFVDLHREDWAEDVAAQLFGVTIQPFKVTDFLDFFIYDLGDIVTVAGRENPEFQTTILQYQTTARIRSTLETPTQNGGKTDKALAGGVRSTVKRVQLQVDHNAARITALAETVDEQGSEYSSLIEQTADLIMSRVAAQYAAGDYLESVIQQLNDSITFRFKSTQEDADALAAEVTGNQSLLEEYIRFKGALIELGKEGNNFTAELDNERLAFLENGTPIAYLSNAQLYITDAQIMNSLYFEDWAMMPKSNGNLSIVYIRS
jgi:hypothetical protein